ncbi:MAG TPA: GNAT family protein [Phycisphaerae bacterium]|nr:GNAT family protein [Phycisphaerae bacterium]
MLRAEPSSGGELVRLRDVIDADLPILYEHQCDPIANLMAAFPARDRDAFFAHWAKILVDPTVTTKTILFDGQVVGRIGSFEHNGERLVGYWIDRGFWGNGITSRALAEFLKCDTTRPLHARVAKHNVASIRVLVKCGFSICGEDKTAAETGGEKVEEWILKLDG